MESPCVELMRTGTSSGDSRRVEQTGTFKRMVGDEQRSLTPAELKKFAAELDTAASLIGPGAQLALPDVGSPGGAWRRTLTAGPEPAGFIRVEVEAERPATAIVSWWTQTSNQREGYATALLHAFISNAHTYNIGELEAVIDRSNEASLRFAAKLGFATRGSAGTTAICTLTVEHALQRLESMERAFQAFARLDNAQGERPKAGGVVDVLRELREH